MLKILMLMVAVATTEIEEIPDREPVKLSEPVAEVSTPEVVTPEVVTPVIPVPVIVIPKVCIYEVLSPEVLELLFDLPATPKVAIAKQDGVLLPATPKVAIVQEDGILLPATPKVTLADKNAVNLPATPLVSFAEHEEFTGIRDFNKDVSKSASNLVAGVRRWADFLKRKHTLFRDKRTLEYDKKFSPDYADLWDAWQKVYAQDYSPITYIPYNIKGVRMIAEMRTPSSETEKQNLFRELAYFKSIGYNAVLAVWRGEDPLELAALIFQVKQEFDFQVWFTFGGKERLQERVFIDPKKYRRGLTLLAEVSDGYVIGWRRTSLHLFAPDEKWIDYSLNCVRNGNPQIPVFGEIYYGYTGTPDSFHSITVNIPENASGVLVVNFGFSNVVPNGVINLVRKYTNLPVIALVVGERPYYLTRNPNHKSKEENRALCKRIEERFTQAGTAATITLAGDGSGGNYDPNVTDNLCTTNWAETKPETNSKGTK